MKNSIDYSYYGMLRHLEDGFGYSRKRLKMMTKNEIIEAFEKEIEEFFNYSIEDDKIAIKKAIEEK